MEDRFDSDAIMERMTKLAREIRKSDLYPAVIGGIAGGIAGALIAAMITGRVVSCANGTASNAGSVDAKVKTKSWAARDVVELITVVAALAKQAKDWYDRERKNKPLE